jgi:hypothetical protein
VIPVKLEYINTILTSSVIKGRFISLVAFTNRLYHAPLSPFQLPVNGGVLTISTERFEFLNPKYDTELRVVPVK